MNTFTTGLGTPRSVAVASDGTVYVTDSAGGRLLALNPTTGAVTVVVASGLAASATNGVGTPDVVPGPVAGSVLVIDAGGSSSGGRIQLVASSSGPVTTLADSSNADSAAIGSSPTSAAADPATGLLYVGTSAGVVVVNSTGFASSWFAHGFAGVSVVDVAFVPASGSQSGSAQLWATLSNGNVQVVNAAAGTLVRTITPPAGVGAVGASVNPITGEALVFSSANSSIVRGVLCGASSAFFMQPCAVCDPGSAPDASGTCVVCAPGSFSASAGSAACSLCPLGSAQPASNSTSCVACATGFYAPTTGLAACAISPPGFYTPQATGSSSVIGCPQGTFRAAPGASSASDCVLCPPGTQALPDAGARSCKACPVGSASGRYNSSSCTACTGTSLALNAPVCLGAPSISSPRFSAVDPDSIYLVTYSSNTANLQSKSLGRQDWGTWGNLRSLTYPGWTATQEISALATDGVHAFLHFLTTPPRLEVVSLATMTTVRTITLPANLGASSSMVVDRASGYVYLFGSTNATLARFGLADGGANFSAANDVFPSPSGAGVTVSAARVSPTGGVVYLATAESPARLLTVRLSDMTVLQTITGLPSGIAVNVTNIFVNPGATLALLQTDSSPSSNLVKVDLTGSGSYVSFSALPTSGSLPAAGQSFFSSDGSLAYLATGPSVATPLPAGASVRDSFVYRVNVSTLSVDNTWRLAIPATPVWAASQRPASVAIDANLGSAAIMYRDPASTAGSILGVPLDTPPRFTQSTTGAPVPGIYVVDPVTPTTVYLVLPSNASGIPINDRLELIAYPTFSFATFTTGAGGSLTQVASVPFPANVTSVGRCILLAADLFNSVVCTVSFRNRRSDLLLVNISAAAAAANGGVMPAPRLLGFNLQWIAGVGQSPTNVSNLVASGTWGTYVLNPLRVAVIASSGWGNTWGGWNELGPPVTASFFPHGQFVYIVASSDSFFQIFKINPNTTASVGGQPGTGVSAYATIQPVFDRRGYIFINAASTRWGTTPLYTYTVTIGDAINPSLSSPTATYSNHLAVTAAIPTVDNNNIMVFAGNAADGSSYINYVSVANPSSLTLLGRVPVNPPYFPTTVNVYPTPYATYGPVLLIPDAVTTNGLIVITGTEGVPILPTIRSATLTVACAAGTVWDTVTSACVQCPSGTFSLGVGTSCLACPPGQFSGAGSGSCSACAAGSYASNYGTTTCDLCWPGSHQALTGRASCDLCGSGLYSTEVGATSSNACLRCPGGSTTNWATGQTSCVLCSPGTSAFFSGSNACNPCGQGSEAPLPGSLSCSVCLPGSFSPASGTANCTRCARGFFQQFQQSTQCNPCSSGLVSDVGASSCFAPLTTCPPGRFLNQGLCDPCPASQACPGGASAPVNCSAGQIPHPVTRSFCGTVAASCSPGDYLEPASSFCLACPAGSFCVGGTALNASCPAGTATFGTGATSSADCELSCAPGSGIVSSACVTCDWGSFSVGGARSSCSSCPPGTRNTTVLGAASSLSCNDCVPGTAWNGTACGACPSNRVCLGGTSSPLTCPTGSTPNTTSRTSCIGNCPGGEQWNRQTATAGFCGQCSYPDACAGGAAVAINCVLQGRVPNAVSRGTFCMNPLTSCSPGQFLQNGMCLQCNTGFACRGGTASPVFCQSPNITNPFRTECIVPVTSCPVGQFVANGVCNPCPTGQVCLGGAAQPSSCPSGQNANWNSTACAPWVFSCPPGWWLNGEC
jgi:hypothetical protein